MDIDSGRLIEKNLIYDRTKYNLWFHGTSDYFDEIDLAECLNMGDFGRGFYLAKASWHAESNAVKNNPKKQELGKDYVYVYAVPKRFSPPVETDVFRSESVRWLDFILLNRFSVGNVGSSDVIIGPTADAHALYEINKSKVTIHSPYDKKIALIKRLNTNKYSTQMCLRSYDATNQIFRVGFYMV